VEKYIYLNTKEKKQNPNSYKRQQLSKTAKTANKARQQTAIGFYLFFLYTY